MWCSCMYVQICAMHNAVCRYMLFCVVLGGLIHYRLQHTGPYIHDF